MDIADIVTGVRFISAYSSPSVQRMAKYPVVLENFIYLGAAEILDEHFVVQKCVPFDVEESLKCVQVYFVRVVHCYRMIIA